MEMPDAKKPATGAGEKSSSTMQVRFSTLLVLVFLSIFAIVLAYIGGVMTGRSTSRHALEVAQAPAMQQPATTEEKDDQGKILTPQELEFARVLRGEAAAKPANPAPTPPAVQAPPQPSEPLPESSPDPQPAGQPEPVPTRGEVFDYVLQMGVFRDENAADTLRQKLEGHGLRTGLERGSKSYVVLVRMRGNAERLAEIFRIATSLRLGEPLMRSRKPVNN